VPRWAQAVTAAGTAIGRRNRGGVNPATASRIRSCAHLGQRVAARGWPYYPQTVHRLERGLRKISLGEAADLADILHTTLDRLTWATAEARTVEYLHSVGYAIVQTHEMVAESVRQLLGAVDAATDDAARNENVKSPLVQEARRDTLGRIAEYGDMASAVAEGTRRYRLRGGKQNTAAQPVVAAIVTSSKGVLVGRRNDGVPPWTFIAGEVEPGEQAEDATVREVKEEVGLEIRVTEVIGQRAHPETGRAMVYVAAEPTHSTKAIVGDEAELAEVRWIGLSQADALLPDMFGPVREYLTRTIEG
jgi:8-oxo-dGTP diphosphatase